MFEKYSNLDKKLNDHPRSLLLIIFLIVFGTRLPFIWAGFGLDADAWRIVNTAQRLTEQGTYTPSRLPGFPLVEFIHAAIPFSSPAAHNLISTLFGALTVGFFALILRKFNSRDILLASVSLSMVPVFYIATVSSMDYVIAMAFITASFYILLEEKYIFSAVLLGLATGARITSIIMIIPFLAIIYNKNDYRKAVRYLIIVTVTGFVLFLPGFLKYGFGLFTVYSGSSRSWFLVIAYSLYELFGIIGWLGIFMLLFSLPFYYRIDESKKSLDNRKFSAPVKISFYIVFALYLVMFFILPYEAAYLLPAIPFLFIYFAGTFHRKLYVAFLLLLIISPFFLSHSHGIKGLIIRDHILRNEMIKETKYAIKKTSKLDDKSIMVVGPLEALIDCYDRPNEKHVYLLDREQLKMYREKGYKIYYTVTARKFNKDCNKIDLKDEGGIDINQLP